MQQGHSYFSLNQILNTNIQYIKGVGPKKAEGFKALKIEAIKDLLLHIPTHFIDRRSITPLSIATTGQIISLIVTVEAIDIKKGKASPSKILCSSTTGDISLIYFNAQKKFLQEKFQIGEELVISGKAEKHFGIWQMIHPDIVEKSESKNSVLIIEPVYPATSRLTSKAIAKTIQAALTYIKQIPEWLPSALINRFGWYSWLECISKLHGPLLDSDLEQIEKYRERLAFDELLAEQILLRNMRMQAEIQKQPIQSSHKLLDKLVGILPFQLTKDQSIVIDEIVKEQASDKRMFRLLQGDVGSGKTVVAFAAMLNAAEAGYQAALMVPTELLANQHFYNLQNIIKSMFNLKVELLTSKVTGSAREASYLRIERGEVQLIIGTHSLIQDALKFHKLGLVIIDEQHRFGVNQRLKFLNKGLNCDFLMMSATPIPRTMFMINYGDMDLSTIKAKPMNRLAIKTTIFPMKKIEELISRIESAVVAGNKIYWVCPLIEESESIDLTNTLERFGSLASIFQDKVALLHSRLAAEERESIIRDFANPDGKVQIVVATTVIEVGIDVPDATIIVIEHAERFGLAQLHQLRGRVGRGTKASYCILLYGYNISQVGRKRLNIVRDSNDGFYLAEQDLLIRGGGKVAGKQQSGLPEFKIFDLYKHQDLIESAHSLAKESMLFENKAISVLHNIYMAKDVLSLNSNYRI